MSGRHLGSNLGPLFLPPTKDEMRIDPSRRQCYLVSFPVSRPMRAGQRYQLTRRRTHIPTTAAKRGRLHRLVHSPIWLLLSPSARVRAQVEWWACAVNQPSLLSCPGVAPRSRLHWFSWKHFAAVQKTVYPEAEVVKLLSWLRMSTGRFTEGGGSLAVYLVLQTFGSRGSSALKADR